MKWKFNHATNGTYWKFSEMSGKKAMQWITQAVKKNKKNNK